MSFITICFCKRFYVLTIHSFAQNAIYLMASYFYEWRSPGLLMPLVSSTVPNHEPASAIPQALKTNTDRTPMTAAVNCDSCIKPALNITARFFRPLIAFT